jgi:hypothetical protein
MSTPPLERSYEAMMERVRHDRAPNHALLDQTEASIWSGDQVIEYVDVLIDKVEESGYRNDQLLARIDRMLALAATTA